MIESFAPSSSSRVVFHSSDHTYIECLCLDEVIHQYILLRHCRLPWRTYQQHLALLYLHSNQHYMAVIASYCLHYLWSLRVV
jgi:hypothetical protein